MTDCIITIDATTMGDYYLLNLYEMVKDFAEGDGGTNDAALEQIEDWLLWTGESLASDAEVDGNQEMADKMRAVLNEIEERRNSAARAEEEAELDASDDDLPEEEPDADWYPGFIDALVAAWRNDLANDHLDAILQVNAIDTSNDPDNLYRAGVFEGLAQAAAWQIYDNSEADDINAITAAIYKAYGVAW